MGFFSRRLILVTVLGLFLLQVDVTEAVEVVEDAVTTALYFLFNLLDKLVLFHLESHVLLHQVVVDLHQLYLVLDVGHIK